MGQKGQKIAGVPDCAVVRLGFAREIFQEQYATTKTIPFR
jgi:hypothetical protein